jgi:hypothetical protein
MVVLVLVLAVILVGGFLVVWMRDKNRSNAVAEDSGRFEADPSHRHDSGRNTGH